MIAATTRRHRARRFATLQRHGFGDPRSDGFPGPRSRQRGSALVEFPVLVGLILIPFGILILSIPTWIERQTAARDAASESARYLVLSGPTGAEGANQIVRDIEAGYGLAAGSLQLEMPTEFVPGQALTVRVIVTIPAADLPLMGSFGDTTWTAEHTERYPDFAASQP